MAQLKTLIYDAQTGVRFWLAWQTEEQYRAGRAFLDRLTGGAYLGDSEADDMYVLETERHLDALFEFRGELKQTRVTGSK